MANARRWFLGVVVSVVASSLAGCGGGSGGSGGSQDRTAVTLTSLGADGFNYTQGSYVIGFAFRPKAAIRVTEVGYYDAARTGVSQTFEVHEIGLYDLTTHVVLATTTVVPSSPVGGLFRWTALASPVTLTTGGTYALVGISHTNMYTVAIDASEATVDADVEILSGAGYSATATNDEPTIRETLIEPNAFDAGNIFGTVPPLTLLPDFGPNFRFAAP